LSRGLTNYFLIISQEPTLKTLNREFRRFGLIEFLEVIIQASTGWRIGAISGFPSSFFPAKTIRSTKEQNRN